MRFNRRGDIQEEGEGGGGGRQARACPRVVATFIHSPGPVTSYKLYRDVCNLLAHPFLGGIMYQSSFGPQWASYRPSAVIKVSIESITPMRK